MLPSVLDDILTSPDVGLLSPEHMLASMPYDEREPPPWKPLRIPRAADSPIEPQEKSAVLSTLLSASNGATSAGPAALARAAQSGVKGKETAMQPRANAQHSPGASQTSFMKDAGSHASAGHSSEAQQHSQAGSDSASMQGARSQEGDFFRLLDSQRPAPRASLQDSDLQQLPRSFSTREKVRTPAPSAALSEGSDEGQDASSKAAAARQEEDAAPCIAVEAERQQCLANAPPAGDGSASRQQVSESFAAQGEAATRLQEPETPDGLQAHADPSSSTEVPALAQLSSGAGPAPDWPDLGSSTDPAPAAQDTSGSPRKHTASESQAHEASEPQHISQAAVAPSSRHVGTPGLLGGAASSDLSYTQLTALLGSAEAQEGSLSSLDSSSPPSTPSSSGGAGADMAGSHALAAAFVMQAEAAAAALPEEPPGSLSPAGVELDALAASQPEQGQVALPGLLDSAASEGDLAGTLEQARDEQRLGQLSDAHAAKDLTSDMHRLAALTGRHGGPVTDAEHHDHLQRLAKLSGDLECYARLIRYA